MLCSTKPYTSLSVSRNLIRVERGMLERCNNRSKLPENGDILLLAHQLFKADKTSKAATSNKANMKQHYVNHYLPERTGQNTASRNACTFINQLQLCHTGKNKMTVNAHCIKGRCHLCDASRKRLMVLKKCNLRCSAFWHLIRPLNT